MFHVPAHHVFDAVVAMHPFYGPGGNMDERLQMHVEDFDVARWEQGEPPNHKRARSQLLEQALILFFILHPMSAPATAAAIRE